MGSEQHYSLRWNDYTVKIVTAFQSLRDEEDFVDVTVACDGHSYLAHKMVLSACSPYFRALLRANPCQHPIVILKDVGHVELERLLEFMYNGEVSIAQDQLAAFLRTAENLKIRGLAGSSDDMDQLGLQRPDVSYSYSSCSMGGGGVGGGGASGRSSPSAGYAPSQGSKDEEVGGDGYHTRAESPPSKRRKRPSAPAAGHADSNTATHTSEGGVVGDASVEIESSGSVSGAMPGEDDVRLDRRELKSEPALPGPSGAAGNQDTIGPHEPGGTSLPKPSSLGRPALEILSPTPARPGPAHEMPPILPPSPGPPSHVMSLLTPAIEMTSPVIPPSSRTSSMASGEGSRKRNRTHGDTDDRRKRFETTAVGSHFPPFNVSGITAVGGQPLHPRKPFEEALRNLPPDLDIRIVQPQAVTYSIVEESSQRKRNKLIDSLGYSYTFKRRSSTVVHWRCTVRNKNAVCKVTIRQRGSSFESNGTHCHPPIAGEALLSQVSAIVEKKAAEGVM